MRRFVEGADRGQSTLFPECLEDWIGEDNPVRVIDVFVDELNLSQIGFDGVEPEVTGRPSYHPSILLKLYIYGYLNRVQSSRRLEREASRNVEVMWLTGRLAPDHKTIANFRKDNGRAIRQVCARFVALCRTLGLLTQASVAIDGSKFKAVNNRDRNFTRAKMERRMAQIEESVARYLQQLDTADRQEPSEALKTKTSRLKEKIAKLKEQIQRLEVLKVTMLATADQQISLTDPDARSMATSGRGSGVVGYNVQVAVDTTHHLIVTHEVTNVGNDRSQLSPVVKEGAFEGIVSKERFQRVQRQLKENASFYTDNEMLDVLTALWCREGTLNKDVIDSSNTAPSAQTYRSHFGGLPNAYGRIGFKGAINRGTNLNLRRTICRDIVVQVARRGGTTSPLPGCCQLRINNELTATVVVALSRTHRQNQWRFDYRSRRKPDILIVARLDEEGASVRYYYLVPFIFLPRGSWLKVSGISFRRLGAFRSNSLKPLYDLCSRMSLGAYAA